jgi:hypothetical protein
MKESSLECKGWDRWRDGIEFVNEGLLKERERSREYKAFV